MTLARRPTTVARAAAVVGGVLAVVASSLALLVATAGPAQASTYRYWTYWWGTASGSSHTGWWFAPQGAGGPVGDGWVLGWRFQTTSLSGGATPRASADFATLCPALATPVAGQVRVALVVDYGTLADAPPGQRPPTTSSVRRACVTIPADGATGARVLAAASVTVRSENGLVCALDGYPVGECAPVMADPTPSPTRTSAALPSASASRTSTSAPAASASPTRSATPSRTATPAAVPPTAPPSPTPSAQATLPVSDAAPAAAEQPTDSPTGLAVGGLLVATVAGSAWWTARRRGRTP